MDSKPKTDLGELGPHSVKTLEKIAEPLFNGWHDVHGCLTGDCPHDHQRDCFLAIYQTGFTDAVERRDQWDKLTLERFTPNPDSKA